MIPTIQDAFNKKGDGAGGADGGEVQKRIHVRSKDPMRIARQLEKKINGKPTKNSRGGVSESCIFAAVTWWIVRSLFWATGKSP
jgi:hypothetical protein